MRIEAEDIRMQKEGGTITEQSRGNTSAWQDSVRCSRRIIQLVPPFIHSFPLRCNYSTQVGR